LAREFLTFFFGLEGNSLTRTTSWWLNNKAQVYLVD